MIHARFDGFDATVQAAAHADDPSRVVLAIGGVLGGGLELDVNDVPELVRQLGNAHVRALSLAQPATARYAHA